MSLDTYFLTSIGSPFHFYWSSRPRMTVAVKTELQSRNHINQRNQKIKRNEKEKPLSLFSSESYEWEPVRCFDCYLWGRFHCRLHRMMGQRSRIFSKREKEIWYFSEMCLQKVSLFSGVSSSTPLRSTRYLPSSWWILCIMVLLHRTLCPLYRQKGTCLL